MKFHSISVLFCLIHSIYCQKSCETSDEECLTQQAICDSRASRTFFDPQTFLCFILEQNPVRRSHLLVNADGLCTHFAEYPNKYRRLGDVIEILKFHGFHEKSAVFLVDEYATVIGGKTIEEDYNTAQLPYICAYDLHPHGQCASQEMFPWKGKCFRLLENVLVEENEAERECERRGYRGVARLSGIDITKRILEYASRSGITVDVRIGDFQAIERVQTAADRWKGNDENAEHKEDGLAHFNGIRLSVPFDKNYSPYVYYFEEIDSSRRMPVICEKEASF